MERLTFNLPSLKVTARSTRGEVGRYYIYRGCSAMRLMEQGEYYKLGEAANRPLLVYSNCVCLCG